jgi:HEAT repeat protein
LLLEASTAPDVRVRAFATWLLGDRKGDAVQQQLTRLLSDASPLVQRRACEAFVRSGLEAPVDPLRKLLASPDRFLTFAARLALERVPVERWKKQVLAASPNVRLLGLLALHRLGPSAQSVSDAIEEEFSLLASLPGKKDPIPKLNLLRMIQLTMLRGEVTPSVGELAVKLVEDFPTGDTAIDSEAARLLAFLQVPGAAEKLVTILEKSPTQAEQIHYALVLSYLNSDWTFPLKRRYLDWYEGTRTWEGGHSFSPYLANIVGASIERLEPTERRALLIEWQKRPFAAGLILANSRADQVPGFDKILTNILTAPVPPKEAERYEALVTTAIEALGKNASPESQALLRTLYDTVPDRRSLLARALAMSPTAANWPWFVKALNTDEPTTLQLVVKAMQQSDGRSSKPDEVRAVIIAALRLGPQGGQNALALLKDLTKTEHGQGKDFAAAVGVYQDWYKKEFPDAPPAELPKDDSKVKFSYAQLVQFLDSDPKGLQGDIERARLPIAGHLGPIQDGDGGDD